jgi:phospholipid/cholesterol/gamma-HCH transport system substrate-binding protein
MEGRNMKRFETETKVGMAIIIAFLVYLLGDMFLRGVSISKHGYVLKTKLRNVSGLMQGDRVTVMGMGVGRVGRMSLQGEEVVVPLRIESDLQLPFDSIVRLRSSSLFGRKEMAIEPGQSSQILKDAL